MVEARAERGVSIEELTDNLNLTPEQVEQFERGELPLDFVQTHAWCNALGVPFTAVVLKVGDDIEAMLSRDDANDEEGAG